MYRSEWDPRREPLPRWMRQSQARTRASEVRQALTDAVLFVWCLVLIVAAISINYKP